MDLQHIDGGIHKPVFKAGLHNGDCRYKLVHFEAQKKYFLCLKSPTQTDVCHSVNTTLESNVAELWCVLLSAEIPCCFNLTWYILHLLEMLAYT
jgi:hypothetical protein